MNDNAAQDAVRTLLSFIGEDANREGLLETPHRVAQAWKHWTKGYSEDPAKIFKSFADGAQNYDEMVVLDSVPVHSFCEHHLTPFIGSAVVGYIPNGRIIGLSKIVRLVDIFAKRLQVQERLSAQIADAMMEGLKPKGVAVVLRAEHLCMSTRGVHTPGVFTTTSALRGIFMDSPAVRAEFLSLAKERSR
jgi:GTP cyclohydrolase IA